MVRMHLLHTCEQSEELPRHEHRVFQLSLFASLTSVCALVLSLLAGISCAGGKPNNAESIEIRLHLDWRAWNESKLDFPAVVADFKGAVFSEGDEEVLGFSTVQTVIEGKTYLTNEWRRELWKGKYDPPRIIATVHIRRDRDAPQRVLDIRLLNGTPFTVEVHNFEGGTIREVNSGKLLKPPYHFEPGEYRLRVSGSVESVTDS